MKSTSDESGRGGSSPTRRELNQHLTRKHSSAVLTGNTWERLVAHEELHTRQHWDHTHADYELPAEWQVAVKDA
jgi:type IV secretory pathway VirD2 relaxase